jgi:hypothetical protein
VMPRGSAEEGEHFVVDDVSERRGRPGPHERQLSFPSEGVLHGRGKLRELTMWFWWISSRVMSSPASFLASRSVTSSIWLRSVARGACCPWWPHVTPADPIGPMIPRHPAPNRLGIQFSMSLGDSCRTTRSTKPGEATARSSLPTSFRVL